MVFVTVCKILQKGRFFKRILNFTVFYLMAAISNENIAKAFSQYTFGLLTTFPYPVKDPIKIQFKIRSVVETIFHVNR